MTGPELRRLMKLRRINTVEAARALDVHPQTIRNLWLKEEVPRLYLMALTTYVWALGMDPKILHGQRTKPEPPPVRTEIRGTKIPGVPVATNQEKPIEKKESVWNRLT